MIDPLFWLGLSILLVAISLTAVLVAALPALQELARAARSAEKLFDTLRRDLPPTLESIRLTGLEISDLTDDVSEGVKSANQVVKQVDKSVNSAVKQAQKVQVTTKGVFVGVKAAWKSLTGSPTPRRSVDRLPPAQRTERQWPVQEASLEENSDASLEEEYVSLEENGTESLQENARTLPEEYHTYNTTNPKLPRNKRRDAFTRRTDPEKFEAPHSEDS